MDKKSEAQIRNEEEVRRILEQRGYSTTASKKQTKKVLSNGFPFGIFFKSFLAVGLLVGGWMLLQNNSFENKQSDGFSSEAMSAKSSEELTGFRDCLMAIDTSEIALDDSEFWSKYVSRYEQTISCYDKYPSVSSSSDKAELENKLARLKENLRSSEANDAEYRANINKIDNELAQNLAKIKKDSEDWEAELLKRTEERRAQSAERDAQYTKEQAERDRQVTTAEAQRQQQEQVAKAKCDEYKTKYGEKTASEIAESDPEVVRAKHDWTNTLKKVRSCTGGNVVYNQSQRELCNSYRNQEAQEAEAYRATYDSVLQQKTTYYRNLRISSCGG
ncbi:MAG: hypothetical protein ACOX0Z_02570 [Candidatus Nanosyncoccaceae bacterium]|jgi:hypothetical protein